MVELPKELADYGFKMEPVQKDIEKSVINNLGIMKDQAERFLESYEHYCICTDERMKDDIIESMSSRINHISQAFCDVMAFIEINEKKTTYAESLSYYVRQYLVREIPQTEDAKQAVDFLRRQNDIVHDYFNIGRLNNDVLKAAASFGQGFAEIAESLMLYCRKKFPEMKLEQNMGIVRKNILKN